MQGRTSERGGMATKEPIINKVVGFAKSDVLDYLREYYDIICCAGTKNEEKVTQQAGILRASLVADINSHDMFLVLKPSCPCCSAAQEVVSEEQGKTVFSMKTSDISLNAEDFPALKRALGRQNLTFPVIFIRGEYIGGCDDLKKLIQQGSFNGKLLQPFHSFSGKQADASRLGVVSPCKPQDFVGRSNGGEGTACTFQLKGHANVIRVYAAFQVLFFALITSLRNTGHSMACVVLLMFLIVDTCIFVLLGPSPFSPIGNISTCIAWKWHGPPTTLIPYKVVFGYYIIIIGIQVGCIFKPQVYVCKSFSGSVMEQDVKGRGWGV